MAFVPVPKDLNRVKTKVMFNLTKRQLICFSIAAAVGVPIFFLAKAHLDLSTAAMRASFTSRPVAMMATSLPSVSCSPLPISNLKVASSWNTGRARRPKRR